MDIQSIASTGQAGLSVPTTAGPGHLRPMKPAAQNTIPDLSEAQLTRSLDAVNKFIQPVANGLEFSIDRDTGHTIVKLVDKETHAVLRQIPSEEILAIAKALDKLQGLLVNHKA